MSRNVYHVATMLPSQKGKNTIVLAGIDLVVPLEMDLDEDPLQDDEVKLVRNDGHFERILQASDVDVTREKDGERLFYCFRDVPPGLYSVLVRISVHEWSAVVEGIVVTTKSARWNDQDLSASADPFKPRPHEPSPLLDVPEPTVKSTFYEYAGDGTE